jgi:hypothetical protein
MSFYCPIQFAPFSRCALQLNVSHFDNEHTLQIKAVTTYAILDEHSNKTLACSELMDLLDVDSPSTGYRLSSCAGIVHMQGRRATGYVVESWDGTSCHTLPTVIECNKIPNPRHDSFGAP